MDRVFPACAFMDFFLLGFSVQHLMLARRCVTL